MRTCMDRLRPLFCLSIEWRPPPGLSEAVNAYTKSSRSSLSVERTIWACPRYVALPQLV